MIPRERLFLLSAQARQPLPTRAALHPHSRLRSAAPPPNDRFRCARRAGAVREAWCPRLAAIRRALPACSPQLRRCWEKCCFPGGPGQAGADRAAGLPALARHPGWGDLVIARAAPATAPPGTPRQPGAAAGPAYTARRGLAWDRAVRGARPRWFRRTGNGGRQNCVAIRRDRDVSCLRAGGGERGRRRTAAGRRRRAGARRDLPPPAGRNRAPPRAGLASGPPARPRDRLAAAARGVPGAAARGRARGAGRAPAGSARSPRTGNARARPGPGASGGQPGRTVDIRRRLGARCGRLDVGRRRRARGMADAPDRAEAVRRPGGFTALG